MTIATADFLAISDSLGLQLANYLALAATTEGTAIQTGADNNLGRVQALTDARAQIALLSAFADLDDAAAEPWAPIPARFRAALAALDAPDATGGIAAYLLAHPTLLISQDFADLLAAVGGYAATGALAAARAMQILDARQRVAALALTSPGTGALATDLTGLGTAHTLQLVAGTDIGAAGITGLSVTGAGGSGTTEALADVPALTARGTVVATTTGTYKTVSALAATGGTRGDVLVLRSSVAGSVRTPAL